MAPSMTATFSVPAQNEAVTQRLGQGGLDDDGRPLRLGAHTILQVSGGLYAVKLWQGGTCPEGFEELAISSLVLDAPGKLLYPRVGGIVPPPTLWQLTFPHVRTLRSAFEVLDQFAEGPDLQHPDFHVNEGGAPASLTGEICG